MCYTDTHEAVRAILQQQQQHKTYVLLEKTHAYVSQTWQEKHGNGNTFLILGEDI